MNHEPECGCDCDLVPVEPKWHAHLTEDDLRRMIEEKIARARRHREMIDRINDRPEVN